MSILQAPTLDRIQTDREQVPYSVVHGLRTTLYGQPLDACARELVTRAVAQQGFREEAAWLRANRHLYFVALRQALH